MNGFSDSTGPTIAEALNRAQARLGECVDSAALDARVLLKHATGLGPEELIAGNRNPVTPEQYSLFIELVDIRRRGTPVAYITGCREFWSMDFLVTPETLIPRPETETLVEQALARIPRTAAVTVADLGTGSGAVALAIAYERPHARVIATDASLQALQVARVNEERLGLGNTLMVEGHWLQALADTMCDVIVSNPPYIREGDPHLSTGDVRYEPAGALVSGVDGLDAIREIIRHAPAHLHPGGWLLLEHGYDQGQSVRDLMTDCDYDRVKTVNDLSATERVTLGQRPVPASRSD